MEQQAFDSWAIVELMGHQRIAGRVTEAEIGGGKLLRVDVPSVAGKQPITKYFGTVAVYAITPCDEETARLAATQCEPEPVQAWSARQLLKEQDSEKRKPLQSPDEDDDTDEYDSGGPF